VVCPLDSAAFNEVDGAGRVEAVSTLEVGSLGFPPLGACDALQLALDVDLLMTAG
jgi:hypothetical protein